MIDRLRKWVTKHLTAKYSERGWLECGNCGSPWFKIIMTGKGGKDRAFRCKCCRSVMLEHK